jgi:hypothetical protein
MPFINVELEMAGPSSDKDERGRLQELIEARNDWFLNGIPAVQLQAVGRFSMHFSEDPFVDVVVEASPVEHWMGVGDIYEEGPFERFHVGLRWWHVPAWTIKGVEEWK